MSTTGGRADGGVAAILRDVDDQKCITGVDGRARSRTASGEWLRTLPEVLPRIQRLNRLKLNHLLDATPGEFDRVSNTQLIHFTLPATGLLVSAVAACLALLESVLSLNELSKGVHKFSLFFIIYLKPRSVFFPFEVM